MSEKAPPVRYARVDGQHVAYRVAGEGETDIVVASGFVSHLDVFWDYLPFTKFVSRLAKSGRVLFFDRRGVGLSDPVTEVPTLEARCADIEAVMGAAGSSRAVLFGMSESVPTSILFAATRPEKVQALVLYGGMARATIAADYEWANSQEALGEAANELILPYWGEGATSEIYAPSASDREETREFYARIERQGTSPAMAVAMFQAFFETDVRHVLPSIAVPTLVLHRRGDRVVDVRAGRWLASRIPGAKYVELEGIDHTPYAGDSEALLGEVEEFLTGSRHEPEVDRVLTTVLFVDLVASTEKAVELGDHRWLELRDRFYEIVRSELEHHRGREIDTAGDGFFATFDGPARAVRCASRIAEGVKALGLEVRAGVHTGEVEIGGEKVGGVAVHAGARVAALAGAGEVLVSSTVVDLVAGSGLEFEERGAHELKGLPGTWRIFRAAAS